MTETTTPYDYSKMTITTGPIPIEIAPLFPSSFDVQALREEALGWHHRAAELEKANKSLEQQVAGLMIEIAHLNARISSLAIENVQLLNPGCKPRKLRKYPERKT